MARKNKKLVGKDALGNSYYTSIIGSNIKRWVAYNGPAEPTKIPALWHIWLHYTDDNLPTSSKNVHRPNVTGTKYAYHPNKNYKIL